MKDRVPEARLVIPTSWGNIQVWACEGRVVRCQLPLADEPMSVPLRLKGAPKLYASGESRGLLLQAKRFIADCVAGRERECPPLRDESGGAFTHRVRAALRKIPLGRTVTYAALAGACGSPRAARAAGTACASNPLPLFIPCHRVLAAGGKMGGYSGGLAWKYTLLEREKALPRTMRRSR